MQPQTPTQIESFSTPTNLTWRIINDGVMGGISNSKIEILAEDIGQFSGKVSLENNGGFASIRGVLSTLPREAFTKVQIRVKGDGKRYSFRIRTDGAYDKVAYKFDFDTQKDVWETIELPLKDFQPTWRGRQLSNIPPINPTQIRQVGFLISDKQEGAFILQMDWIKLI